jgi:hypothetical protein
MSKFTAIRVSTLNNIELQDEMERVSLLGLKRQHSWNKLFSQSKFIVLIESSQGELHKRVRVISNLSEVRKSIRSRFTLRREHDEFHRLEYRYIVGLFPEVLCFLVSTLFLPILHQCNLEIQYLKVTQGIARFSNRTD